LFLQAGKLYAGSVLGNFLTRCWGKLTPDEQTRIVKFLEIDANRMIASACSGSGIGEIVAHALISSLGMQMRLTHSCEKIGFKQKLLIKLHEVFKPCPI
jgi:hypothetical protein